MENAKEKPKEQTTGELVSHHVFMLPFKWSKPDTAIDQLENQFTDLSKALNGKGWKSEPFSIDKVVHYNEFSYFYGFVRDVLYETEASQKQPQQYIKHFRFPAAEGGIYRIVTPIPKSQRDEEHPYDDGANDPTRRRSYDLEIDSVLLHLYDTGVGVLSFHLDNRKADQNRPEDILYINQYGRRVFPPFYPIAADKVGQSETFNYSFDALDDNGAALPHGKELAYEISVHLKSAETKEDQKFWQSTPPQRLKDKGNSTFHFELTSFTRPFLSVFEEHGFELHSILDDRMFVVCWYGNDEYSKGVQPAYFNDKLINEDEQAVQDWWYKYVFVDTENVTVQHLPMRAQLLEKATYLRWADYWTYYGVTDYSFMALTSSLEELRQPWINASFLVTHVQTIYFRLVELTLVQRACLQRFSDDIAEIARLDSDREEELSKASNALYRRFLRFMNRIYFREVTAQVQGVELYDMLHKQSRIRESVESVQEELQELNAYIQLVHDGKRAEKLNTLTIIGAILAGPTLLFSFAGLAGLPGDETDCAQVAYCYLAIGALVTAGLFLWAYHCYSRKRSTVWAIILAAVTLMIIVVLPISIKNCTDACSPHPPETHSINTGETTRSSSDPTTEQAPSLDTTDKDNPAIHQK